MQFDVFKYQILTSTRVIPDILSVRYDCLCLCLCLCFEFISSHIVCRYSGTGTQIMVHIIKNIYVGNNVLHSKPVFTKFSRVLLCMYQPPSTRLGMKCGILTACTFLLHSMSKTIVCITPQCYNRCPMERVHR